jgi:hypothetical protein
MKMAKGMPFTKETKKPKGKKKGKKGAMPMAPPFKVGKVKGGDNYA